jgi:hypothetical protein
MSRPFEVIVPAKSSWIEPSNWFHRGRRPLFLRWMQGFYGYWYHHGRGPVMLRGIEQFG